MAHLGARLPVGAGGQARFPYWGRSGPESSFLTTTSPPCRTLLHNLGHCWHSVKAPLLRLRLRPQGRPTTDFLSWPQPMPKPTAAKGKRRHQRGYEREGREGRRGRFQKRGSGDTATLGAEHEARPGPSSLHRCNLGRLETGDAPKLVPSPPTLQHPGAERCCASGCLDTARLIHDACANTRAKANTAHPQTLSEDHIHLLITE